MLPLLPYLIGVPDLAVAMAITAVALTVGGMVVGRLTGRPLLRCGLRQLLLGGIAVIVTFGIGRLAGGSVGYTPADRAGLVHQAGTTMTRHFACSTAPSSSNPPASHPTNTPPTNTPPTNLELTRDR